MAVFTKKNFSEQLSELTQTFTKTLAQSKALDEAMKVSMIEKTDEIERLRQEYDTIAEVSRKNTLFAENLKKLIGETS